jgi:Tfp pilus assembly protein PilN
LTGEARTMADVLAYVGRLGASPGIAAATLSGHEERASGAVRRVRFSLDVTWRPQQ